MRGVPEAVICLACCLLACTLSVAQAQEQGVQTDTIRIGNNRAESATAEKSNLDTTRWDASLMYFGFSMQTLTSGYSEFAAFNIGIGMSLRIPMWRFGNDGDVYIRMNPSIGFVFLQLAMSAGVHLSKKWYLGAGYSRIGFANLGTATDDGLGKETLKMIAGIGNGSFYGELNLFIPVADDRYVHRYETFDESGRFVNMSDRERRPGRVAIGAQLVIYL